MSATLFAVPVETVFVSPISVRPVATTLFAAMPGGGTKKSAESEPSGVATVKRPEPTPDGPVQYVQSAVFNGEPLDQTWLTARELHAGGLLLITLGPEPSAWGTTTRPPSVSPVGAGFPSSSSAALPADIAG